MYGNTICNRMHAFEYARCPHHAHTTLPQPHIVYTNAFSTAQAKIQAFSSCPAQYSLPLILSARLRYLILTPSNALQRIPICFCIPFRSLRIACACALCDVFSRSPLSALHIFYKNSTYTICFAASMYNSIFHSPFSHSLDLTIFLFSVSFFPAYAFVFVSVLMLFHYALLLLFSFFPFLSLSLCALSILFSFLCFLLLFHIYSLIKTSVALVHCGVYYFIHTHTQSYPINTLVIVMKKRNEL